MNNSHCVGRLAFARSHPVTSEPTVPHPACCGQHAGGTAAGSCITVVRNGGTTGAAECGRRALKAVARAHQTDAGIEARTRLPDGDGGFGAVDRELTEYAGADVEHRGLAGCDTIEGLVGRHSHGVI